MQWFLVQKIIAQDKIAKKDKRIKTCSDFSAAFFNKIESMTSTFHEIRIVLIITMSSPLKMLLEVREATPTMARDSLLPMIRVSILPWLIS